MEDEKKKKKNRKKKNRQNKFMDDTTNGIGDSGNTDHNHSSAQDHQSHASETTEVQSKVPKIDVDVENRLSDGVEGVVLEETVETSQRENNPPTEQQVALEETSIGLQNDLSAYVQKEASLEETSTELLNDNDEHSKEEDILDEKIKRLQEESEIHLHKEAVMESKLLELEKEKDCWLHRQIHLEEEFSHLVGKTDSLLSKEVSLVEKFKQLEMERDLWLEKENSTGETMASLNGNVSRLQAQVMELEESRNFLLHEIQRLGETISGLQIQVENLEKHAAIRSSATADTVFLKPDPQGVENNYFPAAASESIVGITEQVENADSTPKIMETPPSFTDQINISQDVVIQGERNIADDLMEKDTAHAINSLPESSASTSLPVKTIESFEDVAFQSESEDHRNIDAKDAILVSNSPYGNGTNEIVQIPVDENHVVGSTLQPQLYEEKTDIPLSDSPLIGAPFRMVSFFARYVSGADLVNKS